MFKVLKNGKQLGPTQLRSARTLLAAMVLLALLSTAIPFTSLASGPMCTLACCAGRAPHAAGSCMNGSCHAFLTTHTRHHEAPSEQTEQLCGLRRLTMNASRLPLIQMVTIDFGSGGYSEHSGRASKSAPDQASVSTAVLTKPCKPECGSCGSGFASSNRQRNAAALAYADRPRPPSSTGLGDINYRATRYLSALCRRGAPRGPPLSFS